MPKMAMDKLKGDLVAMGEVCEYALSTAIMSLVERDSDLAHYIIEYDSEIDEMELAVDRQCSDLLTSGKLNAEEMRFVVAAAKINNDLERIGDLASHICEHVLFLVDEKSILAEVVDFMAMLEQVSEMIRESINALLERDAQLAWKIIDERKIVTDEMRLIFHELLDLMRKDERMIERCCHILFVAQALQRVGDQAANIAEEVIFTEEGVVVRHHLAEFHPMEPAMDFDDPEQFEQLEAQVVQRKSSREDLKRKQEESRKKARPKSTRASSGEEARAKALKAREKLLKLRAAARTKNG